MKVLLPLVLFMEVTAIAPVSIDPARLEAELAADADVLRALRENGDVSSIVRPVNVRFVGSPHAISLLEKKIGRWGWQVVERVPMGQDGEALDVVLHQTTDIVSIRQLTKTALEIAAQYGVDYDGWGTEATPR